jgi:hypothetical protein
LSWQSRLWVPVPGFAFTTRGAGLGLRFYIVVAVPVFGFTTLRAHQTTVAGDRPDGVGFVG